MELTFITPTSANSYIGKNYAGSIRKRNGGFAVTIWSVDSFYPTFDNAKAAALVYIVARKMTQS